jgi:hypothetical protein
LFSRQRSCPFGPIASDDELHRAFIRDDPWTRLLALAAKASAKRLTSKEAALTAS